MLFAYAIDVKYRYVIAINRFYVLEGMYMQMHNRNKYMYVHIRPRLYHRQHSNPTWMDHRPAIVSSTMLVWS